jgi:hypothetical protein
MSRPSHSAPRGVFSSLLIAVFVFGQAFGCCLVNHKIGRIVAEALSTGTGTGPAAQDHSCCHKQSQSQKQGGAHGGCGKSAGSACCLQDAGAKAPQAVAEETCVLPPAPLAAAYTLAPAFFQPARARLPNPPAYSGPPVYLATLRILV